MPCRPATPELAGRAFRGSVAVAAGLVSKQALRTAAYRRLFQDCSTDSALAPDHALRCRALASVLPPHSAFCGWSAAALHGVGWIDVGADVMVRMPHGSAWRRVAGVRVVKRSGPALATTTVVGLRVEVREEVLFSLAARAVEPLEAVPLVDAALARWPVLARRLPDLLDGWAGRRGLVRARAVLALADGRSESPPESRLRLLLVRAGLPVPVPQYVVRAAGGRFVARLDLAWPAHRVALEYDGVWHNRSDEQFRADRARLSALVQEGWAVVHVTGDQVHEAGHERLVTQLLNLLARREAAGATGSGT